MAHIDTVVAELRTGDVIYLDGKYRTVGEITPSDVAGYVNIWVEGFDLKPFHWGTHWDATKIA